MPTREPWGAQMELRIEMLHDLGLGMELLYPDESKAE
jgi:hypothetical protein